MEEKSRQAIKKYFENGLKPNEDHFGYIIDSSLNLVDDQIAIKDEKIGIKIADPKAYLHIDKKSIRSGATDNTPSLMIGKNTGNHTTFSDNEIHGRYRTIPGNLLLQPKGGDTYFNSKTGALSNLIVFKNTGKIGLGIRNPIGKVHVVTSGYDFIIKSNGNVGIGTTDPKAPFHIVLPSGTGVKTPSKGGVKTPSKGGVKTPSKGGVKTPSGTMIKSPSGIGMKSPKVDSSILSKKEKLGTKEASFIMEGKKVKRPGGPKPLGAGSKMIKSGGSTKVDGKLDIGSKTIIKSPKKEATKVKLPIDVTRAPVEMTNINPVIRVPEVGLPFGGGYDLSDAFVGNPVFDLGVGGVVYDEVDDEVIDDLADPDFSTEVRTSNIAFIIGETTTKNLIFKDDEISARDITTGSTLHLNKVGGDILHYGTLIHSSDKTLKQTIKPLTKGIKELVKLKPVSYKWKKETGNDSDLKYGFIAQDVEKVLNEVVYTNNENGLKGISSIELIPVLVKSIQEQQKEIKALEARMNKLEKLVLKK